MTGSELPGTAISVSGGDKSQEEVEQQQQKECDQLSEGSSSPSDVQKVPLPATSEIKPHSPESSDKSTLSPDLQSSSICPSETKVGGVPSSSLLHSSSRRMAAFSSAGHSKMKRTVSNCNVRNTSTLCSKDSSYVYHCPARRRTQQQKKGHPKVPGTSEAPLSSLDAMSSQFQLALMEDLASDETQSMVELGNEPFRPRGLHGSSLRRGDCRLHPLAQAVTSRGTADADHRQFKKVSEKLPANHRQLLGHPPQQMSHMALERVHSLSGRPTAQIPGVHQEQLLLGHRQPCPHPAQQPHPLTHQQRLPHHPPVISRRGSSVIAKPHPSHSSKPVIGVTRVSSTQVPQTKLSAYHLLPDSKIKLHVPSGRKMESLV